MKLNRLFVVVLAATLLLTGCIPSEYTKGIDAKDYPEKDMPVYDDAIIFEYDADDEEANITYGTEDKLDDVIEFYQDYFDDEGISLDGESEEDDEYTAKGFFEDFVFEITAGEAKGKYEEKLFKTVVEVSIEFLDDEEIEERQGGNLENDIIGFWEVISLDYGTSMEDIEGFGFAMEFLPNGKMDMFMFYINDGMTGNDWEISKDGELVYYDPTMLENVTAQVKIEKDGDDILMYITEDDGGYVLKKTDKDAFIASEGDYSDIDLFDDTDDGNKIKVPTVDEMVLVNEDGYKITLLGFEESYYGIDMKILLENTTEKELNVGTTYVIINGYSMQNSYLLGSVDPNAKLNTSISISDDELALCDIDEIATIEMVLEVEDYSTWETLFVSEPISIDTKSNFVQTYDNSGITLAEENGLKIIFKEFFEDDGIFGPYALFYVENNTDKAVTFSCDDVQMNGFMVSGYIYASVQPGTKAVIKLTFFSSDLEDNNITTIESIKLSFEAIVTDEWEYLIDTDIIELPIN
ncbi:MAG: hypothetical protein AB1Z23_05335 [Eubacteriales bacterium]